MIKRAFGELELQILHILKSGKMTVKDVHRILGGKGSYNTIMTVMNRLVEKKQLARERHGLQYEYWLLPQAKPASLFEKIKEKFIGVNTSDLVSYLIEADEDLTEEELAAMEKILQKAKQKRKKHG